MVALSPPPMNIAAPPPCGPRGPVPDQATSKFSPVCVTWNAAPLAVSAAMAGAPLMAAVSSAPKAADLSVNIGPLLLDMRRTLRPGWEDLGPDAPAALGGGLGFRWRIPGESWSGCAVA